MKPIDMKDLLKKSLKDLVALRGKQRKTLHEYKLKNVIRSLNQPHLIRIARKNIARINTVITQKAAVAK